MIVALVFLLVVCVSGVLMWGAFCLALWLSVIVVTSPERLKVKSHQGINMFQNFCINLALANSVKMSTLTTQSVAS